ncbi:ABC transporter permease [Tessaracoccus aquimaris]|uniref:ABC transporter permease n=1 Tax=Tessaracoccus aquimaris TaxID=1332264 RepID=UPI001314917E|nr:FtsX-like permease family protein [Tessaracoccus aquimaris]
MTTWWAWAARRLRAGRTLVAVLFAVVMLTTAILAGSLGNSGLLATRAAHAALANPVTGDAGIQIQTRMGDDAQQQDTLVRDTLAKSFSPIPIDVWTSLVSEPRSASVDGTALAGRVVMWSAQQLAEPNLVLTDGTWAKGPGEATLSSAAAGLRDIAVGASIDVGGQSLTVTGLWRPSDPSAAMWLGDPMLRTGASGEDVGPLVVAPEVLAASGSPFIRWVVVPDGAAIKPAQLPMLTERAASAAKAVEDADVSGRGVVVTGDLAPAAEQAARESASGDAFGFLPVSVLILIAIVGLTQVAGLLSASREPEESLLVARGASLRQILGVAVGESLLVGLLGSAVGTGLALLVLRLAAGDWSQTRTVVIGGLAGLVIAALCLIGVNARSAVRSARGFLPRRDRARNVAGAALLVLTFALAVISTWQLRSAQSFVRVDDEGRVRLDVISALSPALLLAVSAVAVLVVLAPVTRLVEALTHATRATGAWLAAAQVARGLVLQAVAVVLTVLAVGTATFASVFGEPRQRCLTTSRTCGRARRCGSPSTRAPTGPRTRCRPSGRSPGSPTRRRCGGPTLPRSATGRFRWWSPPSRTWTASRCSRPAPDSHPRTR